MDECCGNPSSGVSFLRRQASIRLLGDSGKERRRLQSSMHLGSTKNIWSSNQNRLQFSRRTVYSGKPDVIGSSFLPFSFPSNNDNSQNQGKESSQHETIPESRSKGELTDAFGNTGICKESLKLVSSPATLGLQEVVKEQPGIVEGRDTVVDAGGSSEISSLVQHPMRVRKTSRRRDRLSPEMLVNSPFQHSATSRSTVGTPNFLKTSGVLERCSLRNLNCTSMPQFLSSGCSTSNSTYNRPNITSSNSNHEGSTARGKGISGCLNGENLGNSRTFSSWSLSNDLVLQPALGTRNYCPTRGDSVSVRTRRTRNREGRADLFQEPVLTPPITWTHSTVGETAIREIPWSLPEFSQSSDAENCDSRRTRQHDRDNRRSRNRHGTSSMERIEEVLLVLEQINHIEQFTYEQLFLFETDSSVQGLSAIDQHRDMRLDIDNMSYEELLALEEKMGTVSTGLTEKAMLKCLKKEMYMKNSSTTLSSNGDYDTKCSICQEEYIEGDEIGKAGCEHFYHMSCIQQWLRMKNWCPVCKASTLS